jgi:hypothetical protein
MLARKSTSTKEVGGLPPKYQIFYPVLGLKPANKTMNEANPIFPHQILGQNS